MIYISSVNFIPWSHHFIHGASGLTKDPSYSFARTYSSTFGIILGGFMKGKLNEGLIKTLYWVNETLINGKLLQSLLELENG